MSTKSSAVSCMLLSAGWRLLTATRPVPAPVRCPALAWPVEVDHHDAGRDRAIDSTTSTAVCQQSARADGSRRQRCIK